MGRAKDAWLADQERGWSAPETFVCAECVEDLFLKDLIADNLASPQCSYCDRCDTTDIAAPAEVVIEAIAGAVHHLYADPTSAGVPYEDCGFVVEPTYTADVLLSLPLDCHEDFFDEVVRAFGSSAWVRAAHGHWVTSHDHEQLADSWHSFVQAVKHETRFHFKTAPASPLAGAQELAPGQMLSAIGRVVKAMGLVQSIAAKSALYRSRVRESSSTWEPDAQTMGAPPSELARAGRMNPAGISYFYCALQSGTAIAETVPSPPVTAAVATFEATREISVLNLCELPPLPSLFDAAKRAEYEWLMFLHGFVAEISEPVRKDGREHIDYVPSQVVSEWFAQVFRPKGRKSRLDGLLYPSAVARGGKNLVLFPTSRSYERTFESVTYVCATVLDLPDWKSMTDAFSGAAQ